MKRLLTTILLAGFSCASLAQYTGFNGITSAHHFNTSGLIFWWRGGNVGSGTTATDSSGMALNGVISNGTVWAANTASVPWPQTYNLSSAGTNGGIFIANNTNFSFTTGSHDKAFTMSIWESHTNFSNIYGNWLFDKRLSLSQFEYQVYILTNGSASIQVGSPDATSYIIAQTPSASCKLGQYNHIVFTYDGSATTNGFAIYVSTTNQTLTTTKAGTYTNMIAGPPPLSIGQSSFSSIYGFAGRFFDVRIYNRALGAQEEGVR